MIARVRASLLTTALVVLVAYSGLHFFQSALGGWHTPASERCTGDFLGGFPAANVRSLNPALFDQMPILTEKTDGFWTNGPLRHSVTLRLLLLPDQGWACSTWLMADALFTAVAAYLLFRALFAGVASAALIAVYAALWLNFFPLLEALRQNVMRSSS